MKTKYTRAEEKAANFLKGILEVTIDIKRNGYPPEDIEDGDTDYLPDMIKGSIVNIVDAFAYVEEYVKPKSPLYPHEQIAWANDLRKRMYRISPVVAPEELDAFVNRAFPKILAFIYDALEEEEAPSPAA